MFLKQIPVPCIKFCSVSSAREGNKSLSLLCGPKKQKFSSNVRVALPSSKIVCLIQTIRNLGTVFFCSVDFQIFATKSVQLN